MSSADQNKDLGKKQSERPSFRSSSVFSENARAAQHVYRTQ